MPTLESEKNSFLYQILTETGLPMKEKFPSGLSSSAEDKIKLRTLLFEFGNNISYQEKDGGIKIHYQNNLIAELHPPEKTLYYQNGESYFRLKYRYMSMFEKD